MTSVPEGVDADLVIWIETTGGKMRIYPANGTWTVESYDGETYKGATITVVGIASIADAIIMATRAICNPEVMLDNERTLKKEAVRGFVSEMMDEYREAFEKHGSI